MPGVCRQYSQVASGRASAGEQAEGAGVSAAVEGAAGLCAHGCQA